MSETKIISSNVLPDLFEGFDKTTFIGIETATQPKLNKTGRVSGLTVVEKLKINPENIIKLAKYNAGLGYDYGTAVRNKLIKEGKDPSSYVPKDTWHQAYKGSTVIREHKTTGELYFQITLNTNNKSTHVFIDKTNSAIIEDEDLAEFLPPKSASKNQGVEEGNEVEVQVLKLDSILSISACGNIYKVL